MRVVKPLVIIEDDLDMVLPNGNTLAVHMAKKIEKFVRVCYKSEGAMTDESYKTFLSAVFNTRRHTGIADHRMFSVTFITDRGVGEEGVRHRMAAPYLEADQQVPLLHEGSAQVGYLKESTRYCDYVPEGKKAKGMTFILPPWVEPASGHLLTTDPTIRNSWAHWLNVKRDQEGVYNQARGVLGWAPEQARAELPLGIKTEYVMSADLGSWWNWCTKRSEVAAHPQMRQLAIPVTRYLSSRLPQFFGKIKNYVTTTDDFPDGLHGTKPKFLHKDKWYDEAALVVNGYYDLPQAEEVYSD